MVKKMKKATVDAKKVIFTENSDSEDFEIKNSENEFISFSEDDSSENSFINRGTKNNKRVILKGTKEKNEIEEKKTGQKKKKENEFTKISWGKEKRNYYQQEDEESQYETEDEEDKLERLKEAIYLNEKEKEKLKEADFDIRNIYLNEKKKDYEDESENETIEKGPLEKHQNTLHKLIDGINKDLNKQKQTLELEINENQKKEAEELIMSEQEEYKILLTDLYTNIEKVYKEISENKQLFQMKNINEKNINPSDINKNTLLYLKKKNETILTYIIYVTYYIFLKVMNSYNYNHPVLEKLIYMNTLLAKANELDPKIKFKINQLNNSNLNKEENEQVKETRKIEKQKVEVPTDSEEDTNTSVENEDDNEEKDEEEKDEEEKDEIDKKGKNSKYRVKKSLITEYTDSHIRAKEKEEKKKNREKIRNEKDVLIKELKTMTSEKPETIEDNYLKKIEKKFYAFDNKLSKKEMKKLMNKSKRSDLNNVGLSTNDLLKFVELPEMSKQNKKMDFEEKKIFRNNINKIKQMKKNELTKNTADNDYVTYKKIDKDKFVKRNKNYEGVQGKEHEKKGKRLSIDVHQIEDEQIQNMLKFKKQKKENKQNISKEQNKEIRKKLVDEENKEVENRRKPDIDIIKNRGLIKKKKSKISSSRAKYRQKFAKKMKAYSGQHTKLREHDDNYSGEQRGINPNIKKSMDIK